MARQSKRVRLTRGGNDAAQLFNEQDDKDAVMNLLSDSGSKNTGGSKSSRDAAPQSFKPIQEEDEDLAVSQSITEKVP